MKDIDTSSETLGLVSKADITANELGSAIPPAASCTPSIQIVTMHLILP